MHFINKFFRIVAIVGIGYVAMLSACTKVNYTPNSGVVLRFSNDSILFDTVFVSVGSITRRVKIFNPTKKNIVIKDIFLAGKRYSQTSAYRLNINGLAANEVQDFELAAEDSMYIFAEVKIDPTQANLPFIVSDSIVIDVGGGAVAQKIYLDAYGQNANFIPKGVLACDQVWTNQKPFVVVDSVLVPQGCTLRIEAGTKVYFHSGASLLVAGTLQIVGNMGQPVVLQNDRLDPPYNQISGAWAGVHLLSSSVNNKMEFVKIFNALNAVRVDSLGSNAAPKLVIDNSALSNSGGYGMVCFTGSVVAQNVLMTDNRVGNFGAALGGNYVFRHCSFVSDKGMSNPSFYANNGDYDSPQGVVVNNLSVALKNCLVLGGLDVNLEIDNVGSGTITNDITHNVIKQSPIGGLPAATNLFNVNVKFVKPSILDYRPDSASVICGKAEDLSGLYPLLGVDLGGKNRNTPPTAGCLECKN